MKRCHPTLTPYNDKLATKKKLKTLKTNKQCLMLRVFFISLLQQSPPSDRECVSLSNKTESSDVTASIETKGSCVTSKTKTLG